MKKSIVLSSICLSIVLFFGCSHQGEGKLPKVKTGNVYFTSPSAFTAGALVEANGTGVLKYGICYSATNNKPDINDECMDVTYEATDWGFRPLGGSDHQAFISVNMYEGFTAATVYVRAYAMTSDGQYVYGKTVSCNRDDENTPWGMLKRPVNGWILQSSSIPLDETSYYYLSAFNINEPGVHYHIYWSNEEIEDFVQGSTEYLPEPSWLEGFPDFCYIRKYEILNLTKNELRIREYIFEYGLESGEWRVEADLVYVPAP